MNFFLTFGLFQSLHLNPSVGNHRLEIPQGTEIPRDQLLALLRCMKLQSLFQNKFNGSEGPFEIKNDITNVQIGKWGQSEGK